MAKSPVYGRGRNRKHRAPRGPVHPAAANINMRGKKSRLDHCWCCVCIDMRDKIMYNIHKQEIRDERDS
jgi:hypothetical protein